MAYAGGSILESMVRTLPHAVFFFFFLKFSINNSSSFLYPTHNLYEDGHVLTLPRY